MKRILMAFLLIAGVSSTVLAQTNSSSTGTQREQLTAEQRAQKQTDHMTKKLQLTAQQQQSIYALNLKNAQQMDAMRNSSDDRRSVMLAMRQERDQAMKKVLTADQLTAWEAMKAEQREKRMQHRQGNTSQGDLNGTPQAAPAETE